MPAGAQRLEAAPAIAYADGDAEDVAEFAIEVREVALRVVDDADRQIRKPRQALGEQAQYHALAATGVTGDQREAALAQVRLFDAPAEVLDLRGLVERLGRHIGGERVELEPIKGEQLRVHGESSSGWESGR